MLLNTFLNAATVLVRPQKVPGVPIHVQIEHTTYCNLSCPQCPRYDYLDKARHMSLKQFKNIIDKLHPSAITLNGLGESLMHPDVINMIRYAKGKKIGINTTSNFSLLTSKLIVALLESGLDLLNISIDAATPATYRIVRKGDCFDTVVDNCREFICAKKKLGVQSPIVRLCFVIQKSNLEEMIQFYLLASQLGTDAVFYQTFAFNGQSNGVSIAQNTDIERMQANLGEIMEMEKKKKIPVSNSRHLSKKIDVIKNHYSNIVGDGFKKCIMPWISLYISVEGEIRPCCSFSGTRFPMGNILETENIQDVFNNKRYRNFRRSLRSNSPPHPVCAQCLPESIYDVWRKRIFKEIV